MENRIDVLVVCENGDKQNNFDKTNKILESCVGKNKYKLTSVNPEIVYGFMVYDEHIQASFGTEEMRKKLDKKYDIILFQNCMTGNPHVGSMSVFFYEDTIQQIVDFLREDGIFINFSGSYYDGKQHEEKEEGSVEPIIQEFFEPKKEVTIQIGDFPPATYDVWRKKTVRTFGMGEKEILKKIDEFCSVIDTEEDAREKFVSLPLKIRENFSEYAQKILDSSLKGSQKNAKKVLEIYTKVKKIEYEDYTDVSIIVRGPDTKQEKDKLKSMFGAWNQGLNAWVFSKKRREEVIKFIANTSSSYVWKNESFYTGPIQKNTTEDELVEIMAKATIKAKDDSKGVLRPSEIYAIVEQWLRRRKVGVATTEFMGKIKNRVAEILQGEEKAKPKTPVKKTPVKKTIPKSAVKSSAVSGENVYQKKDTPEEDDPLYIFYTTLAQEKPDSVLAIQWMVEHGVNYDENVEAYEKLKKQKKLIKM